MALTLIVAGWLACSWLTTHLILRWWRKDFDVDGEVLFMALMTGVTLGPLGLAVAGLLYVFDSGIGLATPWLLRIFGIRDGGKVK